MMVEMDDDAHQRHDCSKPPEHLPLLWRTRGLALSEEIKKAGKSKSTQKGHRRRHSSEATNCHLLFEYPISK